MITYFINFGRRIAQKRYKSPFGPILPERFDDSMQLGKFDVREFKRAQTSQACGYPSDVSTRNTHVQSFLPYMGPRVKELRYSGNPPDTIPATSAHCRNTNDGAEIVCFEGIYQHDFNYFLSTLFDHERVHGHQKVLDEDFLRDKLQYGTYSNMPLVEIPVCLFQISSQRTANLSNSQLSYRINRILALEAEALDDAKRLGRDFKEDLRIFLPEAPFDILARKRYGL